MGVVCNYDNESAESLLAPPKSPFACFLRKKCEMGSRKKTSDEHEVSLSLSVIQAVESSQRDPKYYETSRNGKRKRIYEAVKPIHHFHLEYQLTPGPQSPVYQTDVVTYDIVAKVFSEHDERVVNVWQDKGLNYYGWKHSHKLNMTMDSLLELYHHTLTVRVWNSVNKLSHRARFDRPKAFRLPAPKKVVEGVESQDSEGLFSGRQRPAHLPTVFHDAIPTKRSRRNSRRPSQNIECINHEEGHNLRDSRLNPNRTLQIPILIEEAAEHNEGAGGELKDKLSSSAPEDGFTEIKQDLTMSHDRLSASSPGLKGISRRKLRQLQAEAEESKRIEKEGLIALSMKVADLFGSQDTISTNVSKGVADIKYLEISLCLDTPLMSEKQRRRLNPVEFTVGRATGLQESAIATGHKSMFVKYQFYDKPPVYTPPPQTLHPRLSWNHTTVLLLGTIESELLLEYLRGPPLAIEVHNGDKGMESQGEESRGDIFGSVWSDPLLGTCTYVKEVVKHSTKAHNEPFGVAYFDLGILLDGLKTMEYNLPIVNNRTADKPENTYSSVRSCDYLKHGSHLTVKVKLSHPMEFASLMDDNGMPSQPISSLRPLTPFGRLIFILSNQSNELIKKLLNLVKNINSSFLGLDSLPLETRDAALSTYKLTQEEMSSDSCNVITGFHVDDREKHYVVCEGLMEEGIRELWETLPHHEAQDSEVIKVFCNSDYTFSSRLFGNLDIDLVYIKLPLPLSEIIQQPSIYIRDNLPKLCFTGLMKINELQYCSGLSDVIRSDTLPSPMMITALSLFCLQHHQIATAEYSGTLEDEKQVSKIESPSATTKTRRRRSSWEPLDKSNKRYEALLLERERQPVKDFIMKNIVSAKIMSDESVQKKNESRRSRLHFRSYSEDNKGLVHVYSSQTYNSTVLGKQVLIEQLDPKSRYTYSQQYHSMTLEPMKPEEGRRNVHCKKSFDKFVYPVLKTSLECNVHPKRPHIARIEELEEPFVDNQLHANKLEPTVNWDNFTWDKREKDFERYHPPPVDFGVKHPVTIHLAGDSRQRELEEQEEKEQRVWQDRLVVDDTSFHVLRRNIKTECRNRGAKASTQTEKVKGLLKDEPKKVSFRPSERLRVDNLPALSLIHKGDDSPLEDTTVVGYLPGPRVDQGLKRDINVIPIFKPLKPPEDLHRKDFVLYCGNSSVS